MAWYRTLFHGRDVTLDAYRCPGCGSEEERGALSPEHSFAFPLHGVFRKHLGRREGVATPGTVLYFQRGEEYRTSHPLHGGDEGLVLRVREGTLQDALAGAGRKRLPEPTTETCVAPSSALRMRELAATIRGGATPPLDFEETALQLLGDLLESGSHGEELHPLRSATEHAHRRAVSRVLELCAARFGDSLSLDEIAREAAYSPFHLSRVFKRLVGITIHRHVNRLRLIAALDRAGSLGDLTGLALELGFSSHSHFTTAFRREFGVPPSRLLQSFRLRDRTAMLTSCSIAGSTTVSRRRAPGTAPGRARCSRR